MADESTMKLLDRYIIKKVLSTFFFVMMILVAVITVIDITEKVDKFNDHHLQLSQILGYYLDFVPWISGLLTPIICFIAIVYVTSRLAAHTEIIAMLSSGISFRRLLVPYFIASSVIAGLSFVFNGWIIPHSNKKRLAFEMEYFQNKYYFERRNVHMQTAPNVFLFIQNFNNQSNIGYQFSLEKFQDNRLVEKLTADNIQWDSTKRKWTINQWVLKKVDNIFEINSPGSVAERGYRMDTTLIITPKDFENDAHQYDGMTIPELGKHITQIRFRGATGVEAFETERHIRFAAPFTTFVLVFMGVIVSARKSRGGTGFQVALGFSLAFIFILFFTMTRTFAETGSLSPFLAAWMPNLVFTVISLAMYKYVPR
ncbi:MAG: Lipopolysaccharide export system permease protein LptG [Cytophagales bacterium]|nr:MAG: Lipopolysaccharide export system permease protein LptG [Cytophagales bacterium]